MPQVNTAEGLKGSTIGLCFEINVGMHVVGTSVFLGSRTISRNHQEAPRAVSRRADATARSKGVLYTLEEMRWSVKLQLRKVYPTLFIVRNCVVM